MARSLKSMTLLDWYLHNVIFLEGDFSDRRHDVRFWHKADMG
jgi:hypothetical protein